MDLMERFSNAGVVPVVVLEDAGQALSTARALLAGGIDVMEITFRTDAARDAIQIVAEQCPDMLVGAGTVFSVEQCRQAAEAGARFIVSPGFDPCVVDWCLEHELTVLPGQHLRWFGGNESPLRSLCGATVCSHRRDQRRKSGRICESSLCAGCGRQLAVQPLRYRPGTV